MSKLLFVTDDPARVRWGVDVMLNSLRVQGMDSCMYDWFMKVAPGAIVDSTGRMNEWLERNLELFRKAHPQGGVFDLFSPVRFATRDNSELNSEDFNAEYVDGFSLDSRGIFHFTTHEVSNYYDVDLGENHDISLDSIMYGVRQSDSDENVYSVFKAILERADRDFRCEGEFGLLQRRDWSRKDSGYVEIKNVLPVDTVIPERYDFSIDAFDNLISLFNPSGQALGVNKVFELEALRNNGHVLSMRVYEDTDEDFVRVDMEGRSRIYATVGDRIECLPYMGSGEVLSLVAGKLLSEENMSKLAPCYTVRGCTVPDVSRLRDKFCGETVFGKVPGKDFDVYSLLSSGHAGIVQEVEGLYRDLLAASPKFGGDVCLGSSSFLRGPKGKQVLVWTDRSDGLVYKGDGTGTLPELLSRSSYPGRDLKELVSVVKTAIRKEKTKSMYDRILNVKPGERKRGKGK